MRAPGALAGALCLALIASPAQAAGSGSTLPQRAASCLTSVVFGDPVAHAGALEFRGTVSVACPAGVTFSAGLRSANACRLSAGSGSLHYEVYADAAMLSPLISCEHTVATLHGRGRQLFAIYGRAIGPAAGDGRFTDSLLATVTL